jgi:hypothetical protein
MFEQTVVTALIVFIIVVGFSQAVARCYFFDRLVKLEHDKYHEHWVRDRKPAGFFWLAPGARGGYLARAVTAMRWWWRTPQWARADEEANRLFRYMRLCDFVGLIVLLGLVGLTLFYVLVA